jgi:hypothetical protein
MPEAKEPKVVKREKPPDVVSELFPPEEDGDIEIIVGDKAYPVPQLRLKQYKSVLKRMNERMNDDMDELENLEQMQEFFYEILHPAHPELKKEDFEDMPMFQYSAEFIVRLKLALYKVPLHSGPGAASQ